MAKLYRKDLCSSFAEMFGQTIPTKKRYLKKPPFQFNFSHDIFKHFYVAASLEKNVMKIQMALTPLRWEYGEL